MAFLAAPSDPVRIEGVEMDWWGMFTIVPGLLLVVFAITDSAHTQQCATMGVDVTYGVSNIFITTSLPKNQQGLAGAVINSVWFLGNSFFLGVADMVESSQKGKTDSKGRYKAVFWFATGSAVISLVIIAAFVRMGKAKSKLTIDEKAELPREANDA